MAAREHGVLTLLTDLSVHWGDTQRQILALARALREGGVFSPCVCCPHDAPLAEAVRQAMPSPATALPPLPLLPLPSTRPGSPRSLFRLWRRQTGQRPLLFHSFSETALQLGRHLARLRRAENTLHLHSRHTPPVPSSRDLRLWRQADGILCANAVIRNALATAGIAPEKLEVIHPALDTRTFPQQLPRHDGRFVFMTLEPLEEGGGVDILLKAMAALWQRHDLPPWEVRVIGQGSRFAALLEEARALGVDARLALLGPQALEEVLPPGDAMLTTCTLPQGNWRALAGAWSCGLPLICTATSGNRELLGSNDAALTVPPGDPQALAAAMIRLMREDTLRARLTAQGLGMRPQVDMARMTRQYEHIYMRCAQHKGWVLPTGGPRPDDKTAREDGGEHDDRPSAPATFPQ